MRVIPECPRLIGSPEGIQEGIVGGDWALGNAYNTVRPCTLLLKQTMPMLRDVNNRTSSRTATLTMLVLLNIVVSVNSLIRLILNVSPCVRVGKSEPQLRQGENVDVPCCP